MRKRSFSICSLALASTMNHTLSTRRLALPLFLTAVQAVQAIQAVRQFRWIKRLLYHRLRLKMLEFEVLPGSDSTFRICCPAAEELKPYQLEITYSFQLVFIDVSNKHIM